MQVQSLDQVVLIRNRPPGDKNSIIKEQTAVFLDIDSGRKTIYTHILNIGYS